MNEDNKESGFESRVLSDMIDVLAVINHLEDNLSSGRPLQVLLTMKPRRAGETDRCSVEKSYTQKILIKDEKEILNISKLLGEKLFMADIHIAIE